MTVLPALLLLLNLLAGNSLKYTNNLDGSIRQDGELELLECLVFATDAVGTMIPTQPRVSIHRMSNRVMRLSRKE